MKKILASILCLAILTVAATGCSKPAETTPDTSATQQTEGETGGEAEAQTQTIAGTVKMAGSTSMEKFASALTEAFRAKYPEVVAQAEYTGSSAGVEAVLAGTVDIGNASRSLKEEEKAQGIVENIVAIDGIGIVTDKANTVANLSTEDLIKIYTGEITNWSALGGSDSPIVVIGREAGSGTRGAFEELLKIEEKCKYAQEIDSTGAVMAKVASIPGAIGYVSVDVINDTVTALTIDEVAPTVADIKSGAYKLSRPFVMATKGEISTQSDAVKAIFEYIDSAEGQAIIEKVGLISAK